jgi:hypothetical protein
VQIAESVVGFIQLDWSNVEYLSRKIPNGSSLQGVFEQRKNDDQSGYAPLQPDQVCMRIGSSIQLYRTREECKDLLVIARRAACKDGNCDCYGAQPGRQTL